MSRVEPEQRTQVLAIVGPTGIGKTQLALRIGDEVPIEVVGADSRQVFRHMDIGTAKPSPDQLARVPHHLVSVVDPDSSFSLGEFIPIAKDAIRNVKHIGKMPLIVGGTGQYVMALVSLRGFIMSTARAAAGSSDSRRFTGAPRPSDWS